MIFSPGILGAFGLYLARTSALVLGAPLLGSGSGFTGYRIALIAGVSFLLYVATGHALPEAVDAVEYGLLVLREVLIGTFLAFVLHVVLLGIRVAGELIGHEMGMDMAAVVDPATGIRTPMVTRLYESLFYIGLLALDGHHWLFRALGDSFRRTPVGELRFADGALDLLMKLVTEMFVAGLTFAVPVMVLLLLVSVLIGILARVVPQMNVLEVGFTLRIAVALVALFVFAPLLAPGMAQLYRHLADGLGAAVEELGA